MLCPSCRNPCLDTDTQCPACHTPFASRAAGSGPGARGGLTVRLFIPVGAMLGAAAFTVAPIPGQAKIDLGQAAMAGLGGVVGAAIGTVVGLLFDWAFKDRSPARAAAPAPNAVENAFRIGPATRR